MIIIEKSIEINSLSCYPILSVIMYSTRASRTKPFRNLKAPSRKRNNLLTKENKLFLMLIVIPTAGYIVFSILSLNEEIHFLRTEIRHFKLEKKIDKTSTPVSSSTEETPESSTIDAANIGGNYFSADKASSASLATTLPLENVSTLSQESVNANSDKVTRKTVLTSTERIEFDMFAQTTNENLPPMNTEDLTTKRAIDKNTKESFIKATTEGSNIIHSTRGSTMGVKANQNSSNTTENISNTNAEKIKAPSSITHEKNTNFSGNSSNSERSIALTQSATVFPEGKVINLTEKKHPSNFENNTKENEKDKYNIHNKSMCHIPKLNPYDPSIIKYVGSAEKYNCTKNYSLLFYTDFDSHLIRNVSLRDHNISYCCYKKLSRGKTDAKFRISGKCTHIKKSKTKIPDILEFIAVFCHNKTSNKEELVDMFGFVHSKIEEEIKIPAASNKTAEKVNVIILGLDGISHMNLIRTMSMTHSFISKNLSAVSMNGFSKVGDNTLPNLLPALIGQNMEEANSNCYGKTNYFDDCPFIWKNFSAAGYKTIYSEDAPKFSTFNYWKLKGFRKSPTDYNIRPLLLALEKSLATHHSMNVELCFGPRMAFEITLDYLKKVAYTSGKNNYFGLWWSNVISHDKLNNPKMGDELLVKTLKWLSTGNYLNNTILIFMSDHGIRWGDIRKTYQGMIEERMPFLYTIFPKWFTEKYKTAVKNFKQNSQRLTSPFDLHETLKDILNLENLESHKLSLRSEELMRSLKIPRFNSTVLGPRGVSLFLPIPLLRDCKQAEIPDHYCVCQEMETVSSLEHNPEVSSASTSIVNAINDKISKFPQCAVLKLKSTLTAQRFLVPKIIQDKNLEHKDKSSKYLINLVTTPGDGNFEATVFKNQNGSSWMVPGEISRVSLYGNQSYCVTENNAKNFCYCK